MESKFAELGLQIIAISPDQPSTIRETLDKQNIRFTLLSDSSMNASKAFGLAYDVDEATF